MFPYITNELIEELNVRFPDKSPTVNEDYAQLMWRGGQRSVVDFLIQIHEDQMASQLGE
ncbi:hypothetical protein N9H36_00470 [Planktomarina temperata]|nr:hypothetical protein [Planktomarina temperata]